jgi:uncharacterized membrane protein
MSKKKLLLLRWVPRLIGLAIWVGVGWFLHKKQITPPKAPVPDGASSGLNHSTTETIVATADAVLQIVFFLSGLSFGLAALVAYSLKRHKVGLWLQGFNIIALSVFGYLLVRSTIYAYQASVAVLVQIDLGRVYLASLDPLVEKQTQTLLYLTLFAFLIAAFNLFADEN